MDAEQYNTDVLACPGCAERDRRIARLEAQVKQLQHHVEALSRSAKRQAAPFSRGLPRIDPKPPGRKSGDDYGTKAFRVVPPVIDDGVVHGGEVEEGRIAIREPGSVFTKRSSAHAVARHG